MAGHTKLTWQNVAAPDISGNAKLWSDALGMFDKAGGYFQSALENFDKPGREAAELQFAQNLAQYQDPEQLRQAIASGAFTQGIDPRRVTPEMYAQGHAFDKAMSERLRQQAVMQDQLARTGIAQSQDRRAEVPFQEQQRINELMSNPATATVAAQAQQLVMEGRGEEAAALASSRGFPGSFVGTLLKDLKDPAVLADKRIARAMDVQKLGAGIRTQNEQLLGNTYSRLASEISMVGDPAQRHDMLVELRQRATGNPTAIKVIDEEAKRLGVSFSPEMLASSPRTNHFGDIFNGVYRQIEDSQAQLAQLSGSGGGSGIFDSSAQGQWQSGGSVPSASGNANYDNFRANNSYFSGATNNYKNLIGNAAFGKMVGDRPGTGSGGENLTALDVKNLQSQKRRVKNTHGEYVNSSAFGFDQKMPGIWTEYLNDLHGRPRNSKWTDEQLAQIPYDPELQMNLFQRQYDELLGRSGNIMKTQGWEGLDKIQGAESVSNWKNVDPLLAALVVGAAENSEIQHPLHPIRKLTVGSKGDIKSMQDVYNLQKQLQDTGILDSWRGGSSGSIPLGEQDGVSFEDDADIDVQVSELTKGAKTAFENAGTIPEDDTEMFNLAYEVLGQEKVTDLIDKSDNRSDGEDSISLVRQALIDSSKAAGTKEIEAQQPKQTGQSDAATLASRILEYQSKGSLTDEVISQTTEKINNELGGKAERIEKDVAYISGPKEGRPISENRIRSIMRDRLAADEESLKKSQSFVSSPEYADYMALMGEAKSTYEKLRNGKYRSNEEAGKDYSKLIGLLDKAESFDTGLDTVTKDVNTLRKAAEREGNALPPDVRKTAENRASELLGNAASKAPKAEYRGPEKVFETAQNNLKAEVASYDNLLAKPDAHGNFAAQPIKSIFNNWIRHLDTIDFSEGLNLTGKDATIRNIYELANSDKLGNSVENAFSNVFGMSLKDDGAAGIRNLLESDAVKSLPTNYQIALIYASAGEKSMFDGTEKIGKNTSVSKDKLKGLAVLLNDTGVQRQLGDIIRQEGKRREASKELKEMMAKVPVLNPARAGKDQTISGHYLRTLQEIGQKYFSTVSSQFDKDAEKVKKRDK